MDLYLQIVDLYLQIMDLNLQIMDLNLQIMDLNLQIMDLYLQNNRPNSGQVYLLFERADRPNLPEPPLAMGLYTTSQKKHLLPTHAVLLKLSQSKYTYHVLPLCPYFGSF